MVSKKKKTHIDDIMEWQNHQYDPGHYTGGKQHPTYKADGNPKVMAIWCFVQAGICVPIYLLIAYYTVDGYHYFSFGDYALSTKMAIIILTIIFGSYTFISIWLGIRYSLKAKRKKLNYLRNSKKRKRRRLRK